MNAGTEESTEDSTAVGKNKQWSPTRNNNEAAIEEYKQWCPTKNASEAAVDGDRQWHPARNSGEAAIYLTWSSSEAANFGAILGTVCQIPKICWVFWDARTKMEVNLMCLGISGGN